MRTQIQIFIPLLLLQLFAIQLHAQFTISYNGETSFYLDENCELVFNLGGSVPMVAPTTPGASIIIDTLDVALTGYALGETIIGAEDLDVYFRYEDDQGNDSLYVFQISILDTIPPDLALDTDSVYLSCINELPELSDYLVDDNCDVDGGVSLNYFPLQTLPDFNCDSTVIEATALVVAIDFNGNRDTLLQTVFMGQDTLAPTLSVPNDTIIACADDLAALLDIGLLDTADNCDYITQIDSSTVIQAGACTNDFTLTRYWTLVDTCGNVAIDSQTILVKDELAPIFQTPADTTIDCSVDSSPASLGEPAAVSDNCSGILNLTYTDYLDTLSCVGDVLVSRVWMVQDSCLNIALDTQFIQLIDTIAPTFTLPAEDSIYVACDNLDALLTLEGPSMFTDACTGYTVDTIDFITNQSCTGTYELKRTFLVTDECGNTDSTSLYIFIQDTIPPVVLDMGMNLEVTCIGQDLDSIFMEWVNLQAGIEVEDNCSENNEVTILAIDVETGQTAVLASLDCGGTPGILLEQFIEFHYADACGNTSIVTRKFTVLDIEAPIISYCGLPVIELETEPGICSSSVMLPPPLFFDTCIASDTLVMLQFTDTIPDEGIPNSIIEDIPIIISTPLLAYTPLSAADLVITLEHLDGEGVDEFMTLIGEDGMPLGQTSPSDFQCGISVSNFTIPLVDLLDWSYDGVLELQLVANTPGNITDAINPICGDILVSAVLNYDASSIINTELSYSIDGEVYTPYPLDEIWSTELSIGDHELTFRVRDCAQNDAFCSQIITVIDRESPELLCASDQEIYLLGDSCTIKTLLQLPQGISDNCAAGPIDFSDTVSAFIPFTFNANLGMSVADTLGIKLSNISSNVIGSADLYLKLLGDIDQLGEYYSIYTTDGTLIGTTEIGGTQVLSTGSCADTAIVLLTIPALILEENIEEQTLDLILVSNNPFIPGIDNGGINPCDTLYNTGTVSLDSVSFVEAYLSYDVWDLSYYITGATALSTQTISTVTDSLWASLNVGMHTVSFIAGDAFGNLDTCSYQLDVVDSISPVMMCEPFVAIAFNSLDLVDLTLDVADFNSGSYDNCSLDSMYLSPASITCSDANTGSVDVVLNGIDIYGNVGTCMSELIIQETGLSPSYGAICNGDTLVDILNLCPGDSILLFANVNLANPDLFSFSWYNPSNNLVATGRNAVFPVTAGVDQSGAYTLIVDGPNDCSKTASFPISVISLPVPSIEISPAQQVCVGTPLQLNITNFDAFSGVEYYWYTGGSIGNGNLDTITTVPFLELGSDLVSGDHCFYVEAFKDCCSVSSTQVVCVEIVEQPQAVLDSDAITVCHLDELELNAIAPTNTNWVFEWSGPGINGSLYGPNVQIGSYDPNAPGLYTITLEVYDENLPSCAITPLEIDVEVLSKPATPVLSIDYNEVCTGAEVTLTGSGDFTGVSAFFFIGPTILGSANPSFTLTDIELSDAGLYSLVLGGNGCFSDTSNLETLLVYPDPIAEINSEYEICSSEFEYVLSASAQTGTTSYLWTLPNGDLENGNPTIINNPASGSYILEVQQGLPGCYASDTMTLVVNENPELLSIVDNAPACYPGSAFTLQIDYNSLPTSGIEVFWLYEDALISTDSTLLIDSADEAESGWYGVYLQDSSSNCFSDTLYEIINIPGELPMPENPFTQDDDYMFCVGEDVIFQTNGFVDAASFTWSFNAGEEVFITSTPELVLNSIESLNTDYVQVSYSTVDGCNSDYSNSTNYTIIEIPDLDISAPVVVCADEVIDIQVNNCISISGEVDWVLPDNSILEDACQLTDQIGNSGTYFYKYLYQEEECFSDLDSIQVVVNPLPETALIELVEADICILPENSIQINLLNSAPGVDFELWIDNEVASAFDGNAGPTFWTMDNLDVFEEGSYEIFVLSQLANCFAADTNMVEVSLFEVPTQQAAIVQDTFRFCAGEPVNIEASSPNSGITGDWGMVNFSSPIIMNPNAPVTIIDNIQSTLYYGFDWSLSYEACQDFSVDTAYVYVALPEQANAGLDLDTCLVNSITLTGIPSINNPSMGTWSAGDNTTQMYSGIQNPNMIFTPVALDPINNTEYQFIWTLPDYGCGMRSDTVDVRLLNEFPMTGPDYFDCGNGSTFLNGIEPMDYVGVWSSPNPQITFADSSLYNTQAFGLEEGDNIFYYDFLNGVCGDDYQAEVLVEYQFDPVAIDDQTEVENAGSISLVDVLINDFYAAGDVIVEVVNPPVFGDAFVTNQNEIRYVSDPAFVGEDQLIYQITSVRCGSSSQATLKITIGENEACDFIPNIISPNEDGYNDAFIVPCVVNNPENEVKIFNIWGDQVYVQQGYENNWTGDNLPTGTYYYIIKLSPSSPEIIGFIHLQR